MDKHNILEILLNITYIQVSFTLVGAYNMTGSANWHISHRMLADEDMIVLSRGDAGFYIVNNERIPLKKGRFIYISHGTYHSGEQKSSDWANVLAIRYKIRDRITNHDKSNMLPVCSFVYDCDNFSYYEKLFTDVYTSAFSSDKYKPLIIHNSIISIYNSMLTDIVLTREVLDYKTINFNKKVARYINECIQNSIEIDIEYLSHYFGFSRLYFLKMFYKYFDENFKQYVYKQRMINASHLLITTSLKIKQIAEMLKYSDQYIFCNMFKKFYGISPSAYNQYYKEQTSAQKSHVSI